MLNWDEPKGTATARGWLARDGVCVGFYLEYGPDHYRSPHEDARTGAVYCREERPCPTCQPGHVLAVRYPGGTEDVDGRSWHWFETVAEARRFVEEGALTVVGAAC